MVWAQSLNGVIGLDGGMPWDVPEDLQHFKQVTMGEVLVMGRRTWSSFPKSVRPLPGRISIVVSKTFSEDPSDPNLHHDDVHIVEDLDKGLELAAQLKTSPTIWVVGGGTLYDQAIDVTTVIERSLFNLDVDGDTYAPELDGSWTLAEQDPVDGWHTSKSSVEYRFERWERTLEQDN
ncbi:dihydrofolate reductase [Yaniella halotolerans]|uniref:dihydrofolate reductase n=1 Tax=Yaniella halotolerans TaxID=225453 RepID=UPI0003FF7845|nr:dihydrofolate reductase [Yaniella halotolerans]